MLYYISVDNIQFTETFLRSRPKHGVSSVLIDAVQLNGNTPSSYNIRLTNITLMQQICTDRKLLRRSMPVT